MQGNAGNEEGKGGASFGVCVISVTVGTGFEQGEGRQSEGKGRRRGRKQYASEGKGRSVYAPGARGRHNPRLPNGAFRVPLQPATTKILYGSGYVHMSTCIAARAFTPELSSLGWDTSTSGGCYEPPAPKSALGIDLRMEETKLTPTQRRTINLGRGSRNATSHASLYSGSANHIDTPPV